MRAPRWEQGRAARHGLSTSYSLHGQVQQGPLWFAAQDGCECCVQLRGQTLHPYVVPLLLLLLLLLRLLLLLLRLLLQQRLRQRRHFQPLLLVLLVRMACGSEA
jgi:hypothetical protein